MDSGPYRSDPAPAAPPPTSVPERPADREALPGVVGDAIHGVCFLVVAALALLRFGAVFDVVSGIIAVLALMSLRQAWIGLRGYLTAAGHHPSRAGPSP